MDLRRTDLALEAMELVGKEFKEVTKRVVSGCPVTEIEISDKWSQLLQKKEGRYITIEIPKEPISRRDVSECVAYELKSFLDDVPSQSILTVGLGNRFVTPDALGPQVCDHLNITRHLAEKDSMRTTSAIIPGVMGSTGMDTVDIIRGIVHETKPNLVVVIDALAARSLERVYRIIQVTNTGIHPGSGVGNSRKEMSETSIGVPVIAIGIPTVVDIHSISSDVLDSSMETIVDFVEKKKNQRLVIQPSEKQLIRNQALQDVPKGYIVTPKDTDMYIEEMAIMLSEALNQSFSSTT